MRAVAFAEFGVPENLELVELPVPKLAPDGVLLRVVGAGVNQVDWKIRAGRLAGAFAHVFPVVPGFDAAGIVEAVGAGVRSVSPGDEVFGYLRKHFIGEGTYAEFVTAPEELLTPAPQNLSLLHAAGVPTAGLSAWQTIVDALAVGPGDAVAVAGAAGGVGGFAVQLASLAGARVIGIASEANHEYVRGLGATAAVSYADGGLSQALHDAAGGIGVDAALDVIGGTSLDELLRSIRPGGRVASLVDPGVGAKAAEHQALGTYVFARHIPGQLREIARLIDDGKLQVDVATAPLGSAVDVHRRSEAGHTRGKLVLEIAA